MCWELHREIKRVTIIRYLINWSKSLRPYSSSVFALARQQMENPLPLALESGSQSCHIKSSSQTKSIFQEAFKYWCDKQACDVLQILGWQSSHACLSHQYLQNGHFDSIGHDEGNTAGQSLTPSYITVGCSAFDQRPTPHSARHQRRHRGGPRA